MSGFYKSKYDKNKLNYWTLKDGAQAYRLIPAMSEDGIWHKFITAHFGYKDSAGKMHTFQGVEEKDHKTKMVTVYDAAADRLVRLAAQLDAEKKKPADEQDGELIQKLVKLVGHGAVMGQYNLDKKQYIYAYDREGNIGCLKLSHRAFLSLKSAIDKYKADNDGADPLDPETGVYFEFNRTGTKLDTTVQVSPLQITVKENGKTYKQDLVHVIPHTADQIKKAVRGFDKEVRLLTPEQIQDIVKRGAKAMDEIFGKTEEAPVEQPVAQKAASTIAKKAAPAPVAEAVEEEPASEPLPEELSMEEAVEEAPLVQATPKTLAKAPAKPAEAPKPAAKSPLAAQKTTAQNIADQSDDDFLNSL